jgi:hypothetical protein
MFTSVWEWDTALIVPLFVTILVAFFHVYRGLASHSRRGWQVHPLLRAVYWVVLFSIFLYGHAEVHDEFIYFQF